MKRDRYWVERTNFLMSDRLGEVMTGPYDELCLFARWLNIDPPGSVHDLRERLQQQIMVARGCSFSMKEGIRNAPHETEED